jgi:hypothetical protein
MKTIALILAGALSGAVTFAGPLKKEHVAGDAKWLVHLDVENFLGTQLGEFVGREILDKQFAKLAQGLKKQVNIDLDWRQIHSITAYGSDLKKSPEADGVLVVRSGLEVADLLDTVIAQAEQAGGKAPLRKVEDAAFPLYSANNEIFGAPGPGDIFLLSKSREHLEKARDVLAGQAPNLTTSKSFPNFGPVAAGFLQVTVADALAAKLPPQAKALKDAEGAQVVAGEKADNVFVNLAVNAKDSESATQMQQVVQGLVALAALNQTENKDLQQLVQATKVSSSEKMVTVNVELPTASVIAKVSERQKKRGK